MIVALLLGAVTVFLARSPQKKPNPSVKVLAVSSTGNWAAGGTASGTIRVWNLKDRRAASKALLYPGKLNDLRFSGSDDYLAIANQDISLVPVHPPDSPRLLLGDHANYGTVRFSPDGRSLLTVNGKGVVSTVELATGAIAPGHCCTSIWGEVDFAPGGDHIVWAGHWPGLWAVRLGTLAGRLTASQQFMTFGPIAFDARGTVFMGSQDGRVYQWDLETRKLIRTSSAQPGYVRSIAVIGNTGWIAHAADTGPVHLWHPGTGASRIAAAAITTSNLVFDNSRNATALGTAAGKIEFWDLLDGRLLNTLN